LAVSIDDQIAALGAQLESAILKTYTAVPSGGLASSTQHPLLAFLPGDIPVPVSTFVESVPEESSSSSGQTPVPPSQAVNPMLVTTWLRSGAGADLPLLLQTDQPTVLDGPPSGFTSMSDYYAQMLDFAQPLATAGQDDLEQMLLSARAVLPGPSGDTFPLATEPSDWPMPSTTYWTAFSFTSTSTSSDAGTGQPASAPTSQPVASPPVWSLRLLEEPVVANTQPVSTGSVLATAAGRAAISRMSVDAAVGSSAPASGAASQEPAASSVAQVAGGEPIAASRPAFFGAMRAMPIYRRPFPIPVGPVGPVGPPPVQTSATQITLEHMIVAIDRTSWWQNDWLVDPGWYVPAKAQGSVIGVPAGPNQAWALPVALILVRNLTLTGSWSSEDTTQLTSGQVLLGPFNLGAATKTTNADSTVTISLAGPTVLAFFCQPLCELPPSAPPANGSASGSGTGGSASTSGTASGGSGTTSTSGSPPSPSPQGTETESGSGGTNSGSTNEGDLVSQLPTIQSGASGDPVARAQGLLRADARTEYTDATLPIDGSFGPVTQQAVEAFQKSSSLTVDGVVGPMTWQTLLGL
jgi:hypothetical protein